MEISFLGTGAADFLPQLKKDISFGKKDRSVRRSTSTLINGNVLIDCGVHTAGEFALFNEDIKKVEHIIITHFHADHYNLKNLKKIAAAAYKPVTLWYCHKRKMPVIDGVIMRPVKAERQYSVGELKITPHEANHAACALHYEIEGDKKLYYALDGGWILNKTFNAVKDKKFDALIIDATCGDYEGDYRLSEHNSLPMIRSMVKSFKNCGMVGDDTRVFLDHIAVTLNPDYKEQVKIANKSGFTVAYDGMKTKI